MARAPVNTDLLQTFVEVVRAGSFAAVARSRRVTPSSISRAMAALEEDLGVRLFHRTTRTLTLTEAGQRYVERLEPLLEELQSARDHATRGNEVPRGTLRLTAPLTFAQLNLMPLLPAFAERYPELTLELVLTDALVDFVGERIDVGIRLGRLPDSTLVSTRLCEMRYSLCASPGYLKRRGRPQHPSALEEHDTVRFAVSGRGPTWRFRKPSGKEVEVSLRSRLVAANGMALRQAAEAGLGITLLPRWNVAQALAEGTLVELLPEWTPTVSEFEVAAWLLYPSREHVPAKVRAFVDWIRPEFRAGAPAERVLAD